MTGVQTCALPICNGGKGGFNQDETEQLRGALIDLSNRIRRAAEEI